jgi:hypothetical protein
MDNHQFAYCPKRIIATKSGPPYDRKIRVETAPDSGCGVLVQIPQSEHDYLHDLDLKYRPWEDKTECSGVKNDLNSRTTVNG